MASIPSGRDGSRDGEPGRPTRLKTGSRGTMPSCRRGRSRPAGRESVHIARTPGRGPSAPPFRARSRAPSGRVPGAASANPASGAEGRMCDRSARPMPRRCSSGSTYSCERNQTCSRWAAMPKPTIRRAVRPARPSRRPGSRSGSVARRCSPQAHGGLQVRRRQRHGRGGPCSRRRRSTRPARSRPALRVAAAGNVTASDHDRPARAGRPATTAPVASRSSSACMNASRSPSRTADVLPVSTSVRWSLTIW